MISKLADRPPVDILPAAMFPPAVILPVASTYPVTLAPASLTVSVVIAFAVICTSPSVAGMSIDDVPLVIVGLIVPGVVPSAPNTPRIFPALAFNTISPSTILLPLRYMS